MKRVDNKSGFTLIEIIVVLIIVGILASIALPNLFGNIQKSKSAQALTLLDSYKTPMEACFQLQNVAPGTAPCTLAGQNLSTAAQNGWTITAPTAAVAQTAALGTVIAGAGTAQAATLTYTLVASDGTNTITLTRLSPSGVWSCSTGTASPYTGIC